MRFEMKKIYFNICLNLLLLVLLAACASPGSPDGGPFDETPPKVVSTLPVERAVNSKSHKITLLFDEFVKLNNPTEKIIISPPQLDMPDIKSNGRRITVNLRDTLKENTTYTIDFGDAIEDNNEGNPMGNYAFVFSTGPQIDTMEVSGKVLEASNLEPVKGILVGLHSDTAALAFVNKPFERVGRTDGSGHFVIKGVAPGSYRIYALKDADGNFQFNQKNEEIAFLDKLVVPSSVPAMRSDTVWHDSIHIDTIRSVPYTRFLPDDIVLRAFTEKVIARHLLKVERLIPEKFSFYFTAPSTERPIVKGLNFDEKDAFVVERNLTNDTLTYWLRDTLLARKDTLEMSLTYMESNDSTEVMSLRTDTLDMVPKVTYAKQQKDRDEKLEIWAKANEKKKKKGLPYDLFPPREWLELRLTSDGAMAPDENVEFTVKEPLLYIDTAKIHLSLQVDTLWKEVEFLLKPIENNILRFKIYGEWRPDQRYKLSIDSACFMSIYGKQNKQLVQEFSIASLDMFSSLFINLHDVDSTAIVELLNGDKISRSLRAKDGRVDFFYVKPGTYYLRLFLDKNGNGIWDTGLYSEGIEPEEVYYYPHKFELKARWDIEQDWHVKQTPLILQKPEEITKQKPDQQKKIQSRNAERLRNK